MQKDSNFQSGEPMCVKSGCHFVWDSINVAILQDSNHLQGIVDFCDNLWTESFWVCTLRIFILQLFNYLVGCAQVSLFQD